MRKVLLSLLILASLGTNAQNGFGLTKKYKVVPLLREQTFVVNSASNAYFAGGKSRIVIPLPELPLGTESWYYSVLVEPISKEGQSAALMLFAQLSSLVDQSGLTAALVSSIATPPSSGGVCDIYILDRMNGLYFEYKKPYQYVIDATRKNFASGTVPITQPNRGRYAIGFLNPSSTSGVRVKVEVAAVVGSY